MSQKAVTEPASRQGPATVVIVHRLGTGLGDEYRRWQDEVNAAAATFPGFFGTEATASHDTRVDPTIIYRFDSVQHLEDWLSSPIRIQLLERAEHLFDAAPTQHVLVASAGDDGGLATVVVSHPVRSEDEPAFLDWQQRMTDAERIFPGFRGSELFRPVPGIQDDWTAVYRFASDEDLERWLSSDAREELLREGQRFKEFQLRKITSSFGSWFSFDDASEGAAPPAPWKTAMSVLVGLYPTVVLLTLALSELWPSAKLWESLLVGNVVSVALLTWVVMPLVTRALRFWLAPPINAEQPRIDLLGLVASVIFLTACAFVFWLMTVALWTLP